MNPRFKRIVPNGQISAREFNRLQEEVERQANLTVLYPLRLNDSAGGRTMMVDETNAIQAQSLLIVRITSSVPTNDCYPAVLESFSDDNLVISATDGDPCWFYPLNGEPVIEGQRFLVSQIATDPNG